MTFEDCLKERERLTLASMSNPHFRYLNHSAVKREGQGAVTMHYNSSFYTEILLPECDLQKELDNVCTYQNEKKRLSL